MSRLRRRKHEREIADRKLAEADARLLDIAVRRSRLDSDIAVYLFRKGAANDRTD